MSNIDIIRAWKDEEYRNSLSEEERVQLPENPAGLIELSDAEMETVSGGIPAWTIIIATAVLTCGLCHTAYSTCGHGGCQNAKQTRIISNEL
ncbi:mersacidin/lichenicidin family type 2 lantibiotic [Coleofasciculus sp. G2-EDA-02]|uniref:mersacidin/lichenicidin family type 2 lantibiotic n=1 Tax=Coleofasciculus sp. G2-EDA-02 TaxID=3069529 RepID=UPI0032FCD6FA